MRAVIHTLALMIAGAADAVCEVACAVADRCEGEERQPMYWGGDEAG
jgi:hypothetical protein